MPIPTSIEISPLTIAQTPKATPTGNTFVTEVNIQYLKDIKNRFFVVVIKNKHMQRA